MKGRWRDAIELAALRVLFAVAGRVSEKHAIRLGRSIGDLLYGVVGIRRAVALENLRLAFPEKSEAERRRIARNCYRNFATTAIEFARLPSTRPEERLLRCEIVGREHLDEVAAIGRGAILLSGHFGNWEWMGSLFPVLGHPTKVIVGEQRNAGVGELMNEIRRAFGVETLSATHDLRGILEALSKREFVAIVADQDAGRDGIFVDFLGRPASTAPGPARLSRRFGAPILMGFGVRSPDGGRRLELQPPILVPQDGDENEIIRRFTERWTMILERYVRAYPEHWFWMHRRWKTRPERAPKTRPERGPETRAERGPETRPERAPTRPDEEGP